MKHRGSDAQSGKAAPGVRGFAAPFELRTAALARRSRPGHFAAPSGVQCEARVSFKAIRIDKSEQGQNVALVDFDEKDLMDGDVTVAVEWSTVNYKDGLAITGKAPVVRRFPMIPGIDFAGVVERSSHPEWKAGDRVVLNGWGVGETHLGGHAEKARVKGDWLVPLPSELSAREAMAIGTAGYTAMLAVLALERHGIVPARGPVVVTGAAGGV